MWVRAGGDFGFFVAEGFFFAGDFEDFGFFASGDFGFLVGGDFGFLTGGISVLFLATYFFFAVTMIPLEFVDSNVQTNQVALPPPPS